uniref:Sarcolemmal membrane-associated protein n=1 Tax=Sinocyclocheilus anshuiensis TaxID=1608454 RepID=A0A671RHE3_9TELE
MPSALAVFTCRPNSHPFQERHVYLDEPVKIGRSVARCRPAQNNATFDCKVLSRNHALVWFDHKTGKFYLQDTKSSNGTFINSQRLSRGSEESPPCEVLSGDIIQFGVDVTENTRKGEKSLSCIKDNGYTVCRFLFHCFFFLSVMQVSANTPSMYSQELFQLSQYLQEALHREQMLEQKLATLQRLLHSTQEASESSWQALIDEDRLLSRLEVMGNQLQAYSKNQTEDGIRKELVALTEDKHNYETTAKESLRRVLQEKIEVVRKLSEVERSLSNTEDECTHLREMNERTQEELSELANKYNGAVNEIKDLTEKIKLAEVKHEELTQKGLNEKKELQLKIEEMEEKEQALQARIEALQADNDFTNERLTALQDHFLLKSGGDCTLIQQYIECQCDGLFRSASIENQIDAKESDMSDTLSPSKDKSSDDTSGAVMIALCESLSVFFSSALLEEERRTNRQQTEESAKQIHFLQTQLAKLQSDMEALREQRENTITTTREELYSAQEEILLLRHAMEAATAEREREIAALQGDLSTVTAELDKWRQTAAKYEVEISNLQASFQLQGQHQERASQLQGELEKLQAECSSLQNECDSLRAEKTTLIQKLHRLEEELDSSRERSATLSSSLNSLEKSQGDLENKLGSIRDQHQQDASKLKIQLAQAESHTRDLQKEYDDTQNLLSDLRQQYEQTEQEKYSINDELEQCKVNLKLLQEKGSNSGWVPWMPVVAAVVAVTAVVLYPNLSKSSS